MRESKKTGEKGEEVASDYLKRKGFDILERNYKNKHSEIDIVAKKEGVLVFVEVRSTNSLFFGTPEETIDFRKMRKLEKNALAYTFFNDYEGEYRVDVVTVVFEENKIKEINHYENVTV